jgi:hypothetical protein
MSIYKLYVMTHNSTGLKYLGYTTKDLNKYFGSGVYWIRHLKVHGFDISREVIHECTTKEELKQTGRYYSDLWDVVNSVDKYGKKLWANEKPEEGTGGGILFTINNPMKDPNIVAKRSGEFHHMKDSNRRKAQSIRMSNKDAPWHNKDAMQKKSGNNHYLRKNPATHNPVFDHNIYIFENISTGEVKHSTAYDFCKMTGASRGNVSQLVNKKQSPKSVKGWRLFKTL